MDGVGKKVKICTACGTQNFIDFPSCVKCGGTEFRITSPTYSSVGAGGQASDIKYLEMEIQKLRDENRRVSDEVSRMNNSREHSGGGSQYNNNQIYDDGRRSSGGAEELYRIIELQRMQIEQLNMQMRSLQNNLGYLAKSEAPAQHVIVSPAPSAPAQSQAYGNNYIAQNPMDKMVGRVATQDITKATIIPSKANVDTRHRNASRAKTTKTVSVLLGLVLLVSIGAYAFAYFGVVKGYEVFYGVLSWFGMENAFASLPATGKFASLNVYVMYVMMADTVLTVVAAFSFMIKRKATLSNKALKIFWILLLAIADAALMLACPYVYGVDIPLWQIVKCSVTGFALLCAFFFMPCAKEDRELNDIKPLNISSSK